MATYKVQDNGKAQSGLKTGDQVVTAGGTWTITGFNPDGTYQSKRTGDATTSTYTGSYANSGGGSGSSGGSGGSSYTMPSGYTGSVSSSGSLTKSQQRLIDQMNQNSISWYGAGSDEERSGLHSSNEALAQQLAAMGIGVDYDKIAGAWTVTGVNRQTPVNSFSYASAPSYTDKYSAQIEQLLNGLLNRDSFSYDAAADPMYQQYLSQYQREGQRAMQDAYGQAAARTGGLGSSWAQSAAQQANNYYASMAADKIPELYQLAYEMYLGEIEGKVRDLGLLENMSDTQYNRYRDTMSDWRDDRNFAYRQYQDDVSAGRYADELSYSRGQTAKADAQGRIADYLAAGGSVSALSQSLVDISEYTPEELAALELYYAQRAAGGSGSRSSGSASGSGSRSSGSTSGSGGNSDAVDYEDMYEEARASGNPQSWLAQKANYGKYGLTSSTGLYAGYKEWAAGGGSGTGGYDSLSQSAKTVLSNIQRNMARRGDSGLTQTQIRNLRGYLANGTITEAELNTILDILGYKEART